VKPNCASQRGSKTAIHNPNEWRNGLIPEKLAHYKGANTTRDKMADKTEGARAQRSLGINRACLP